MWKKMNRKEYLFAKRKRKRAFLKYFIIFAIAFVPVVAFNMAVSENLDNWLVIFLDCVIMLAIVLVGNVIAKKILDRKDAKLNAKIREREELEARKKQILEDSYKKKREAKKQSKETQINEKSEEVKASKPKQKKKK